MVEKFKSRNLRRPSRQMLSQKGEKHVAMDTRQGGMVGNRTGTPHKCFRTNGCKFSILTFTKNLSNLTIHIQMNNKAALPYPLENRVHTV